MGADLATDAGSKVAPTSTVDVESALPVEGLRDVVATSRLQVESDSVKLFSGDGGLRSGLGSNGEEIINRGPAAARSRSAPGLHGSGLSIQHRGLKLVAVALVPALDSELWPVPSRQNTQSMDYQIVSGSPTFQIFSPIPRISSSFLSSSFKKQDSAFFSSSENLRIPFLPGKGEDAEQGLGGAKPICKVDSDASITYLPSKFADAEREEEGSSFTQAMLNGLNVLAGVGVLSTPYALKEGGFLGIILLFALAAICCYTGILLRRCLDSQPGMQSYPDIGQAAFGTTGRFIISIILYIELYACCVEFIILEGDNLSALFPGARLDMGGLHLDSQHVFCIVSALVIMPTVWLRDLSVLSYVSAGGVVATLVVVFSVFWVGAFDGVGFHRGTGPLLNIAQLPVSIGLYGFCYSGHAVFPNVYTSMKRPQDFNLVLQVSFFIVSLIYGGMAVMGISMFGQDTLSSITLNLPKEFLASKIAVWTTVINPITKYPLF
ncbi:hypothetical protein AXG93_731s1210 [Marchantia polymorpha subsp. ruderalis]|uniref:Amino acid transporter transmembrane domain-containing protein n=1 Tax=Marchantia polymorpha subsp. ruderalis TaxID=1480154 RepID=A0A176VNT8_MARPO|nr:hypothetical protein AXG93_731s1210 [Marchantia polymorpha subsp. ruderalis]